MKSPKFDVGTIFLTRHKHPKKVTIIDILFTYDRHGKFVKFEYVGVHFLMGQAISDKYVETCLLMGKIEQNIEFKGVVNDPIV